MSNTIDIIIQAVSRGVADTIKKTTHEISSGFKRGQLAVKAFNTSVNGANKAVSGLSDRVKGLIAAYAGFSMFRQVGNTAAAFNSTIEQSQIGLAALVRTFMDVTDAQGNLLTGAKAYDESMKIASKIQKQLQIEGLKTTATYEQLLKALQEGIGPAFKAGFNPEQVVKFTSQMTQAAAAISLPMNQLGQELRAIMDGTIDRNARIAKALGLTNVKIKEMAANGKLFEYLTGKLKEFEVAGGDMAKTFSGAKSNVTDALQMIIGKGFEKSFQATTDFFLRLRDAIVTIDEAAGTFKFNQRIVEALAKVDQKIRELIGGTGNLEQWVGKVAEAFGAIARAALTAVSFIGEYHKALMALAGTVVIVSILSKITLAVKGLTAAFLVLTGSGFLAGLSSLGVAITTIITSATLAGGAMAAAFIVTAGLAINEIIKLGQALWETHKVSKLIEAIKTDQKWVDNKAADKLKEVNAQLGMNIKSLEEFNGKIKDGSIAYDKASGKWVKATTEYKKAMAEAGGYARKLSDREIEEAKRATAGLKKELDLRLSEYEKLNNEVLALQNKLQDQQMQREDDIREIRRRGMSEEAQQRDLVRQADQKMALAREILTKSTEELTEADIKRVEALAGQAKSIYKNLDSERKAVAGVKKAWDVLDAIVQRQEASKRKELDKTITKIAELQTKIEKLKEDITINVDAGTEQALKKITGVRQELALLQDKTITVTVRKRTVETHAAGGMVGTIGMADGGSVFPRRKKLIPGQGSKDDVPALLMRGEYVLRKDAVKKYGSAFLDAINRGGIAVNMLPRFAMGGLAGAGKKIKRAVMQTFNPSLYVTPDATVLHPSHPSFYTGINNRMGRISTPIGKKSGISLTKAFSAGIRKMQSGGNIDSATIRLEKERRQITDEYNTRIEYAIKSGNEELAWILEEEKLELEQLAIELEQTLAELQMDYEEELFELRAAHEEKMADLRQQQNEAAARRRQIEMLMERSQSELSMSHNIYKKFKGANWGGKFYVNPRVKAKQYEKETEYYRQIADYQRTISSIPDRKEFELKEQREQALYDNRVGRVKKKYKFETAMEQKKNEFDVKKTKAEAAHDFAARSLELEKEIKLLEADLAKELYELEKKYTTTNISGATHWLAKGGHLGYPAGFTKGKDSVPAMLTPGEYVIREQIVRTMGKDFFDRLNNFQMPRFAHYAEGGLVQNISGPGATNNPASGYNASVTFNINQKDYTLVGQKDVAERLVNELKRMELAVA